MTTVEKLNAFLAEKQWKPAQLGRAANIGSNRAADIVAERFRLVSIEYLKPLADALAAGLPDRAVSLDWLVDDDQDYPPPLRDKSAARPPLTPIQERLLSAAAMMGEEYALKRVLGVPEDRELPSPGGFVPVPSETRKVDVPPAPAAAPGPVGTAGLAGVSRRKAAK
jgi:hypothetical protein